ncbi:MAG: AMP-binding protein [Nostoc sp.]|uniref:AMP-binding protein n=1 Tax=Nostoc sp. TaxID=1180 RepID=UPI002FF3421A
MTISLELSPQRVKRFSTFVEVLNHRALYQPNQTAYTFLVDGETEEVSFTYQELDRQAKAIAALLQNMKATGERALLLYPPGLEFIAAFFGCLYAGVTAVPVYPPRRNQHLTRLQAIVSDAQATFALTTQSMLVNIERGLKEELANLCCITTDNIASDLADDWQASILYGNTLAFLQYTSGSTGTPKGVIINHDNLLHNSALIQKGFDNTSNSRGVSWLPPYHDMGLIGGILQPLYVGASMALMSPVTFMQKPLRWLKAISRYKATTSGGPNFAYELCVNKITPQERENLDLSSWQVAFNGAEPIRAETLEQFARTFADCGFRTQAFYPCYGLAEATLFVSGGLKTAEPVIRYYQKDALEQSRVVTATPFEDNVQVLVSCGQSLLNQKIVIADPESFTQCPDGKVGEIWVSGTSVARGYWNKPESEQTFRACLADTNNRESFLCTGDLGFLQDGELFVTGRLKDLIIIRGRNHYPQDIELTVDKSHPALRLGCGAAFGVEINGVERLVIAQEIERDHLRQLDVNEVVGAICQAVSKYHELQVYAVVLLKPLTIPKTSSGKIQRHACRSRFLNGSLDLVGDWAENPRSKAEFLQLEMELEEMIQQFQTPEQQFSDNKESKNGLRRQKLSVTKEAIEVWLISVLAISLKTSADEIDTKQPFSRYGLDSSVAISITSELADWLGHELEPTIFWEYPSIEALAQYLEAECQLSQSPSHVGVSGGM